MQRVLNNTVSREKYAWLRAKAFRLWLRFMRSRTAKLFATGLVLWLAAAVPDSFSGWSWRIVSSIILGAGVGFFLFAAFDLAGVELKFLPRFMRAKRVAVFGITPLAYWMYTTDADDRRAIEHVRLLKPEWTLPQSLSWLAEHYQYGLHAAGRNTIDVRLLGEVTESQERKGYVLIIIPGAQHLYDANGAPLSGHDRGDGRGLPLAP